MIELISTEAKSKAQQIRDYVAANPNATPTEIAKTMKVNRQYVYTVMWKTKVNAGVKLKKDFPIKKLRKGAKKLGRPRKVTEASENLKRLVDEYKASKAKDKTNVDLSPALKFLDGRAQAKKAMEMHKEVMDKTIANWKTLGVSSSKQPLRTAMRINFNDKPDPVNHPAHYKVGGIETIDFIEAKKLNYNIGNVVKYLTRADHKGNKLEDLRKAQWYLTREINALK